MRVILLANDLVPGASVPVAAPGLRVHGLALGLRAHGHDVTVVVPQHAVDRVIPADVPAPSMEGVAYIPAGDLVDYLETRAPAVVILTNSNHHTEVAGAEGVRQVFDFFAPKILELVAHRNHREATDDLSGLRERKIAALADADAVIVNGRKKLPYALAWMLQTDRDATAIPLLNVPMCMPVTDETERGEGPVRVAIAGYLQHWSLPGPWLEALASALDEGDVELHILLAPHWGGRVSPEAPPALRALLARPGVVRQEPMTLTAFREFLAGMDVVLDLFDYTLEREYAMVTRTVVAITCGCAVIHPSVTEVSPEIERYEAGWLIDLEQGADGEADELRTRLTSIFADRDEIIRRRANARRLAREVYAPEVAVAPLARLLDEWSAS